MRRVVRFSVLAAALAGAPAALAEARDAVVGYWASDSSILEIALAGETLTATVRALKDPVYRPDEAGREAGAPRRDDNNPDEALRDRPILGMQLLSDYAFDGKRWQGRIYDPESGNTYSSHMRLDDGRLKMRGYIAVPMLGRTQVFEPVATCTEGIRELIELAALGGLGCD